MRSILTMLYVVMACTMLLVAAQPSCAQEQIKVLAVRGKVTTSSGAKVSVGQLLANSEKLTLAAGAYTSVVHPNGRSLEIKTPTTVTVRELQQRLTRQTSSSAQKFASYVANELTETSEPIAFTSKRRGNMKTTGSVERAAGDDVNAVDTVLRVVGAPGELQALAAHSSARIDQEGRVAIVMPRTTRLLSDTVTFTWRRTPKWTSYRMVITDRMNVRVFAKETSDTTLTLVLGAAGVQRGELYSWRIEAVSDPSERTPEYSLWILDGSARTEALELLNELASAQDDPTSAIAQLIRAAACEDLGLIYDAYRSYMRAVSLEPEIQSYRRACAEFLVRQSLNIEALAVYESQ